MQPRIKLISFYAIMVLFPFVLLVMLELGLRIVGFGQSYPLFIENPLFPGYLQANPQVIQRYFARPEMAPNVHPDTSFFEKQKSTDTFRIFVQGGSTAAGFPYGRWASLQGMLEQRFKRLYPNKKIEVINTSMAAVNSYTLLDFVDEIQAQSPDLVVIYAGHNEYLGIMGVGSGYASMGSRDITLLYIKAKNLRLYQALEQIYYAFAPSPKTDDSPQKRSLMELIAKETDIAFNSELYQKGVEQFSENLASILSQYQKANIPVMIGNLVSNESDQVPFSSVGKVDWDAYEKSLSTLSAKTNIATLTQLIDKQQNTQIEAQVKTQIEAQLYFKLALNYYELGQFQEAKTAFIQARDLDRLRFRAPAVFNDIIAHHAQQYGARFVDAEKYFIDDSVNGIIGKQHMLEHLHPTSRGYFILGEAYVDSIVNSDLINSELKTYTRDSAWQDIPLTEVDRLVSEYNISKLTSAYPFTDTPRIVPQPKPGSIVAKTLQKRMSGMDWQTFHNRLIVEYKRDNNLAEAAKIAANVSDAIINDPKVAVKAAKLYLESEDLDMALYYYRRANALKPSNAEYLKGIAQVYFFMNKLDLSREFINKIKQLN
ncbi:MAG: hypothetical protein COA42_03635 [Alteromonadaceae bacterium]|nr:MAG: hypothetical protein COA42_03635 [Alteromonadaceae bacterium]